MTADAVIVGSGINALVAGALLARKGWGVTICERSDYVGGAICTRTDVFDGYTVELLSSWHPLFVGGPAYAELAADLAAHGLEYLNTTTPTGVVCADGAMTLSTDPAATTESMAAVGDAEAWNAMLAGFGAKADLAFGVLGLDFWRRGAWKFGWKAYRQLGRQGLLASGAEVLEPAGPWLDRTFNSPVTRALLGPWALHNGLGPEDSGSAFITQVIGAAIAWGGMPVPVGGGVRLVEALTGIITGAGGQVLLGSEVTRIEVSGGRATGVRLADGTVIAARRAVLASVTPQALYSGLLADAPVDPARRQAADAFRYGRAGMQIHLALSEAPDWVESSMRDVAIVHVLDSMDSLTESVSAAGRGLLPRRPTIVVGQPTTVDPSRAPAGKGLLWIQLQENPRNPRGDLAGQISVDGAGWTPELRDAYADRVIAQLEPHIRNIRSAQTGRQVLGPADLQALNINLVGGDPYAGDCRLDQYALWRPLSTATGHATGITGLWQIGASTHPGPGLGGGSGYQVASRLLG
ncbi:MAG: phytoene desaturase family protein [Actinomycetales bacterium]